MERQKIIFSTKNYSALLELILQERDEIYATLVDEGPVSEKLFDSLVEGTVEVKEFPDMETYHRLATKVEDKDVIIVGGTPHDMDLMEIYDLACAAVKSGAHTLTLFIPYFSYSTMERAVKDGEVVKAKNRARILSCIPQSNRNTIYLFDLHVDGLTHYFEGSTVVKQIKCDSIIKGAAKQIGGDDFVFASTDSGRAKQIEKLAGEMCVDAAYIMKKRISGTETEVKAVYGDVEGKNVVIYDDMIRTGGSLINAGKAYKEAGAKHVYAIATHGIFPQNALARILDSGGIDHVTVTDTHPMAYSVFDNKLPYEVRSIAGTILDKIEDM